MSAKSSQKRLIASDRDKVHNIRQTLWPTRYQKLKGRAYQLKETRKGGMGVVDRAATTESSKADVSASRLCVKPPHSHAIQLWMRAAEVQVALNHPNIASESWPSYLRQEGQSKPYFVTPVSLGMWFDKLVPRLRYAAHRAERRVEILSQVCRESPRRA